MLESFVLVVDDNPETLNLLAFSLENAGIRVHAAKNVLRAIEELHDGSPRPGLIISDLVMPQTTGWDFIKHLRDDEGLRHIPVVVVTGADAGECAGLADLVLQKPVDPLHLVEAVRQLMLRPNFTDSPPAPQPS